MLDRQRRCADGRNVSAHQACGRRRNESLPEKLRSHGEIEYDLAPVLVALTEHVHILPRVIVQCLVEVLAKGRRLP
jgi:hypothetical protein